MTAPAPTPVMPVRAAGADETEVEHPRPRKRRVGGSGVALRPGFLSYGLLLAWVLGTAYPLWWSFVVASGTNATRGETLPLIPGGNFLANAARVLDAIPF